MIYIIDLREEQELSHVRFISKDRNIQIISIPARYIFANQQFINEISKKSKVLLLCKKGIRSCKVKNMYFRNNPNIQSIDGGLSSIGRFSNKIEAIRGNGGFGMEQYILQIYSFVIVGLILAIYFNVNKIYILIVLAFILGITIHLTFFNSIMLTKKVPYKF